MKAVEPDTNSLGQRVGFPLPGWAPPRIPSRDPMEGRYCRVESLDPDLHARSLFAANGLDVEGRMWTYLSYGPFESYESYRTWIDNRCQSKDSLYYAIVERKTNRAVGIASYSRLDPPNGCIEVGHLAYSPLLQRTVAATEAMYLMMERAFRLRYRRYEWKCNALNTRSRTAAQRLGMSFEGVFRQAAIFKGRSRDTAWYAAIDCEWPALMEAFSRWLAPDNFDDRGTRKSCFPL